MTFAMSLLGGICVWGISINIQAVSSETARRRKLGIPTSALPRSWESLWRASPSFVLSGVYIALSVIFAFFLIKFSGPKSIYGQSFSTKLRWTYEHVTAQELFGGGAIWTIPLFAAMLVFVRSAIELARRGKRALNNR